MAYRTQEEWAVLIEAFKQSGQPQAVWCQEHGISSKTLQNHIREKSVQSQQRGRSAADWSVLIEKQKASGINRNAWCRERGISPDSMTSAEKRITAKAENAFGVEWAEFNVGVKATASPLEREAANYGVKIHGKGVEIEIDSGYPVEKLAILIERLVKPC